MADNRQKWVGLAESEWLSRWQETADRLDQMQRDVMDPDSLVDMADVEAAHLDGEISMLRRVLQSREL